MQAAWRNGVERARRDGASADKRTQRKDLTIPRLGRLRLDLKVYTDLSDPTARVAVAGVSGNLNCGVEVVRVGSADLRRCLAAAPQPQLSENTVHVILYSCALDPEKTRDFFVRQSLFYERDDLMFATR